MNPHPFAAALVVATAGATLAQAPTAGESWIGKAVLPTKSRKEIRFVDRVGDRDVPYAFSGRWPFTVRDDRDGWLRVHDGSHEGWVYKNDFVLTRDALTYFDGRLRGNPNDWFALDMRGAYWLQQKDADKAIADFDAALRLNATDATVYNDRGLAWALKKDYDRAIADYTAALQINPRATVTYTNRALSWRMKREYDKAIADCDAALQVEPRYLTAFYSRGVSRSAKKEYDQAIADFDAAIQIDPKYAAAFNDRGLAWAAKKDYDRALKDYNEALRLNPKSTVTYSNRGSVWNDTKQYDKAIADFETAIKQDPKFARALGNLSWMLATCPEARIRSGVRAVELATRACELTQWNDPSLTADVAAACAETGDFSQAVRYEKQAQALPNVQPAWAERSRARLKAYEDHKPWRQQ